MPVALFDSPMPLDLPVLEQSSGSIYAALRDGDDQPFSPLLLSSLTLTLYTMQPNGQLAIVNGRFLQNVLNTNGVTLFPNLLTYRGRGYNLRWDFTSADTTPIDDREWLRYIARFAWQWTGGVGQQELAIVIQRVRPVIVLPVEENVYFGENYFANHGFGG